MSLFAFRRFAPARLTVAALLVGAGAMTAACTGAAEDADDYESEDAHETEDNLTSAEKAAAKAKCAAIPRAREWSQAESDFLLDTVVRKFTATKKEHDRLIAERGIGSYGGIRTDILKTISSGDKARAAAMIAPHVKAGYSARAIVDELRQTSCVGWVLKVLKETYTEMGRADEWRTIESCTRAWDSDGLHLQQALINSGWPSPALGVASDEKPGNWSETERGEHQSLLNGVRRGLYWDVPLSKTIMLKNFLPVPGTGTPKDERMLLEIGSSKFFSVGIFRGAYHVPIIIPARSVPSELAPTGSTRASWIAAKNRGEPFILESHSLRQPWDPTNFEVRPMTEVMGETYTQSVKYSVGTMLFSPKSQSPLSGNLNPNPNPQPEPQPEPEPNPTPVTVSAGAACAPGCIYSSYCTSFNQTAKRYHHADGTPLVCVKVGDCRSECQVP